MKFVRDNAARIRTIARWIGQCTVLANEFPVPGSVEQGRQRFLRDSQGKPQTRLAQRGVKRRTPDEIIPPSRLGYLPKCPRWEALRQRVVQRTAAREATMNS